MQQVRRNQSRYHCLWAMLRFQNAVQALHLEDVAKEASLLLFPCSNNVSGCSFCQEQAEPPFSPQPIPQRAWGQFWMSRRCVTRATLEIGVPNLVAVSNAIRRLLKFRTAAVCQDCCTKDGYPATLIIASKLAQRSRWACESFSLVELIFHTAPCHTSLGSGRFDFSSSTSWCGSKGALGGGGAL